MSTDAPSAEQLLADAAWLKRLALSLAGNANDADDLVQESWIAVWQREPDTGISLRPWFTKVMRDIAGMRRRSERRRTAREQAEVDDRVAARPDVLLEQVRLHRLLVDLVLELEEPYRSTIISRFLEGRTAASIAKAASIPESTVRGRIRDGLARLRDRLDREQGNRKAWAPAVLAFGKGASVATVSKTTIVTIAAVLILLLLGAGVLVHSSRQSGARSSSARSSNVALSTVHGVATSTTRPWWNLEGVVLHPLAGRVIARNGKPIAGAQVEIYGWSAVFSALPEAVSRTDAGGNFRFPSPRDTTVYRVVATAPTYAGRTVNADPRAPAHEQDPEHITIVLAACDASVEGTVNDSSGGPIVGATVRVAGSSPPFGPTTSTTSTGHYSMCLARDDSALQVGADGYEHVVVPVDARGSQHVDVVLAPGGTIFGRVVDADTGEGVANAQVIVAGGSSAPRHAVSDADGHFELVDVAAGRLRLNVWTADHGFPGATDVEVVATRRAGPVIIPLPPGTTARGLVRAEGKPLPGAVVRFEIESQIDSPSTLRAVTGSDGRFVAPGVARAQNVRVFVDGATVTAPTTLDMRQLSNDIVIEVQTMPPIRGHVVRHGVPVPDAVVRLVGESSTNALSPLRATTDSGGRFELPAPPAGSYAVYAECKAIGAFMSGAHPIKISAPVAPGEDVAVELDGGARISGVVTDRSGTPLAGLAVKAVKTSSDDLGNATTAVDGAFVIDQLAGGGDYKLTVAPYAGAPQSLAWASDASSVVTLRDGDAQANVHLSVVLTSSTIRGTVVDDQNAPVADAIVRAGPAASDITSGTAWPLCRTNVDGRFELHLTSDGPFRLEAGQGGRPRARVDNVAAGASDVTLRMTRVGGVQGKLVNLSQAAVAVRALDGSSSAFAPGTYAATVDGDAFQISDLTPGDYAISAVTSDGHSAAVVASIRGGESTLVTLSALGSRRFRASVNLFGSGAPVAGVRCVALAASGDVWTPILGLPQSVAALTDATGVVVFDAAPAGDTTIECQSTGATSSGGTRVTDDQPRIAVVAALANEERPGAVGIVFDWSRLTTTIAGVMPGTAAATAGLQAGDVIESVDGKSTSALTADGVRMLIGSRASGSNVNIGVVRGQVHLEKNLVVGPHG